MTNKKDKRTNNDLHNITQKPKDLAKRTPLNPDVTSCAPEGLAVFAFTAAYFYCKCFLLVNTHSNFYLTIIQ